MIQVPAGDFEFGSDRGYADESPILHQREEAFWIDRTEVTNAQFSDFVKATGYVTTAERGAGMAVFDPTSSAQKLDSRSWWHIDVTANWHQPQGKGSGSGSGIKGRENEPVVGVSYTDALAYAEWLGRTLPTERQWEYAAKAGRNNQQSDAGLRDAQGRPAANYWQGYFPLEDKAEDGFRGKAPAGCFPANAFGLYDMVGNVWEWTRDPYTETRLGSSGVLPEPDRITIRPDHGLQRVIKGGSYLCSADYCVRARASSRQPQEENLPAVHIGIRTVSRAQ